MSARYAPLDEVLSRPRIKALRALRFFDWCCYADLLLAGEVPDDSKTLDTFRHAVYQAIKRGEIEKLGAYRDGYYRITAKGRAVLSGLCVGYARVLECAA